MDIKRAFDLLAGLAALVVLSPLLVLIGIIVRLDSPGPALFWQERVGLGGRVFRIAKFRTMRHGAPGAALTVGADERITRLGRLLRASKLDELPQLINVVRGEMSLVGPRPELPAYMALYSPEQRALILSVRPGITDFAAIAFRDEAAILARAPDPESAYVNEVMPKKFALYKRYVEERSFWLDLRLIGQTLLRIVRP